MGEEGSKNTQYGMSGVSHLFAIKGFLWPKNNNSTWYMFYMIDLGSLFLLFLLLAEYPPPSPLNCCYFKRQLHSYPASPEAPSFHCRPLLVRIILTLQHFCLALIGLRRVSNGRN